MSKFFINRPIFAAVLALLIMLAGGVTLSSLPIALYPQITPPTVEVTAYYPGANAQTIAETVGTPIEQQVNGVEKMIYMQSTSSSAGIYTLTVTFEVGTDIDMATILVQNRVSQATSSLPSDVTRLGIKTEKKSTNIVMMLALVATDSTHSDLYLSNYANLNILDELRRIPGVGSVSNFGADDYSMRAWLNPEVLQIRGLTPLDVQNALREQNVQVSAGKIGEEPSSNQQVYQYSLNIDGRLISEEEFGNVIIRALDGGRMLRLKDVAVIELGSKTYNMRSELTGKPTAAIGIYQLPDANSLSVAEQISAKMEELKTRFPKGLDYTVALDTTRFIEVSIEQVYHTLFEAIILVLIVILLFLQNFRSMLIPAVTIPVSLIGTFAVMGLMGFSINTLTLFGMVLAIGIVVDDAIIVVENVSRHLDLGAKNAREATIAAMEEITSPIVGTVLVLLAVFIPTAFMGGITGELYKQFALTIAVSTAISGFNALTLSPALCALILKKEKESKFFLYRYFNKYFDKLRDGYTRLMGGLLRKTVLAFTIYIALAGFAIWGFMTWPTSFIPAEDQGYYVVTVNLPNGASLHQTEEVMKKMSGVLEQIPGVKDYVCISGFSILTGAQISNGGTIFVTLKDWTERTTKDLSIKTILQKTYAGAQTIEEAEIFPFLTPAIQGLGTSGGFELMVQDRKNLGVTELEKISQELGETANLQKELSGVRQNFEASIPQLYLDIDRDKVKTQKLSLSDVFNTLSIYLGSSYVNDFIKFGRIYQVKLQAGTDSRAVTEDILKLSVRNEDGQMVPFSTFVTLKPQLGTEVLTRYNMYSAALITGNAGNGYSSGEGNAAMVQTADQVLGTNFGHEWTGMAYQEEKAGSSIVMIFALAIIVVILVLAAQYESFTSPMAVIMAVPIALLGAVLGCMALGLPISIYTQIGIVLLIGLAAKNAILIVEFSRDYRKEGKSIYDASLEAGHIRFRPILMTSFAFILGVLPLVTATGAGAASRVSLGIAVFAGMLLSTIVGTAFVPNFYQLWQTIQEKVNKKKEEKDEAAD